jgi:hypothetical protein
MWPLLSTCFKKYESDNKVAESCCRTLRFALRCTEKYSRNILEAIVNLVNIYLKIKKKQELLISFQLLGS